MIHEYRINGRLLKTGDVISTKDGAYSVYSLGYRAFGDLMPGRVDHSILYLGPDGLCAEAGIFGVITFMADSRWDTARMLGERGLEDRFIAASSVLDNRGLSLEDEQRIRRVVRSYALNSVGKPYNLDFFYADDEQSLNCSQLVYLAYKRAGIDIIADFASTTDKWHLKTIFPQEILDCTSILPSTDPHLNYQDLERALLKITGDRSASIH